MLISFFFCRIRGEQVWISGEVCVNRACIWVRVQNDEMARVLTRQYYIK